LTIEDVQLFPQSVEGFALLIVNSPKVVARLLAEADKGAFVSMTHDNFWFSLQVFQNKPFIKYKLL
jgi:hypothetical protein